MKETKVYVDELPKSCSYCPCCSCDLKPEFIKIGDIMYCNLLKQAFRFKEERKKLKDCPLIDIKDHDREKDKRIKELEQDLEFTTKTANELIEIKHKLEQELAELKEKAIVPRFRIGQEIWYVRCSSIQSWIVNKIELDYMENDKLCEIYRLGHYGTDDYSCCMMPFDSDRYFATEKEAQGKLKEIQGDE